MDRASEDTHEIRIHLKQFYSLTFLACRGSAECEAWRAASCAMCIFFLTFESIHLIKGTQARSLMSGAYFDVKGESTNEIRNQEESGPEEESCCQENEVAERARNSELDQPAPSNRGRFIFVSPSRRSPAALPRAIRRRSSLPDDT